MAAIIQMNMGWVNVDLKSDVFEAEWPGERELLHDLYQLRRDGNGQTEGKGESNDDSLLNVCSRLLFYKY